MPPAPYSHRQTEHDATDQTTGLLDTSENPAPASKPGAGPGRPVSSKRCLESGSQFGGGGKIPPPPGNAKPQGLILLQGSGVVGGDGDMSLYESWLVLGLA